MTKKIKPGKDRKILLYDTTLRDGDQSEYINFSKEDKLRILEVLDDFGMDYVEGGWTSANPRDSAFFKEAKSLRLKHAKLVAFALTRRADRKASRDTGLRSILRSGVRTATVVGKTWDMQVKEALRISFVENLRMIHDSVAFLKKHLEEVIFDAEHFFDGFLSNPDFAVQCVKTAQDAGADCVVLCDTNGGMIPSRVNKVVGKVIECVNVPLGIHAHNDSDLAVANTIAAVEQGVVQVQGTMNGYGERCGNANLCSVIPNIQIKLDRTCLPEKKLARLQECSRVVAELANQSPSSQQPYVGGSAFAHKGGIHVSAVSRNPRTYEHISPEKVGNRRRFLISDLSGRATVEEKAREFRLDLSKKEGAVKEILDTLKTMEEKGYRYEGAEASFELLMKKALGRKQKSFKLLGFRVLDEKKNEHEPPYSEATVMIERNGQVEHTAAEGTGPVNALDNALRKALEKFFPQLETVRLLDYKVRVLPAGEGTSSNVRVLIESGDGKRKWSTVGVSTNIIEASWQALLDAINYKLQLKK